MISDWSETLLHWSPWADQWKGEGMGWVGCGASINLQTMGNIDYRKLGAAFIEAAEALTPEVD